MSPPPILTPEQIDAIGEALSEIRHQLREETKAAIASLRAEIEILRSANVRQIGKRDVA